MQTNQTMFFCTNNIGFVRLEDSMGDDLSVVNAARVSFNKRKEKLDDKDIRLMNFLANSDPSHTMPFRHIYVTMQVKAPIFVLRQWQKHLIGCEYSFEQYKDTPWSEQSGRYIAYDGYWTPDYFRIAADNKKQGSIDSPHPNTALWLEKYKEHNENALELYQLMLEDGVAPEQARTLLGMNMYTNFYWTSSLQAVAHFVNLRDHEEAQKEIKEYAEIVDRLMTELFPISWSFRKRL